MATSSPLETSIGGAICLDSEKDLFLKSNTFRHSTEIVSHSTESPSRVPFPDGRLLQRKICQLEQDLAFLDSSRDQMHLDHAKTLYALQSDQHIALSQISDLRTQIQTKTDMLGALEIQREASTQSILRHRQETARFRSQKRALLENNLWLKDEIQRKDEEASVILSRLVVIQSYCERWTVDHARIFELEKDLIRELEKGAGLSEDLESIRGEHQSLVEELETLLLMFKKAAPVVPPSCSSDHEGHNKNRVESSSLVEVFLQRGQDAWTKPQRQTLTGSSTIKSLSRLLVHHHQHSKTNPWLWGLARWTRILFFYSRRVVVKAFELFIAALKMAVKVLGYSIIVYAAGFISGLIL